MLHNTVEGSLEPEAWSHCLLKAESRLTKEVTFARCRCCMVKEEECLGNLGECGIYTKTKTRETLGTCRVFTQDPCAGVYAEAACEESDRGERICSGDRHVGGLLLATNGCEAGLGWLI